MRQQQTVLLCYWSNNNPTILQITHQHAVKTFRRLVYFDPFFK